MELSHVVSDVVLTLVGLFVFFRYLYKLELAPCLLWEAFILSITGAAFFGAIRFAGYPQSNIISEFFQHLAGTVGAFCLVFVSFFLVLKRPIPINLAYVVVASGFVAFGIVKFTDNLNILSVILTIAIPLVLLIGIWALFSGSRSVGAWLILGVIALVMGTYNKSFMPNTILDPTDTYHYLLAVSVFCLGRAARHQVY